MLFNLLNIICGWMVLKANRLAAHERKFYCCQGGCKACVKETITRLLCFFFVCMRIVEDQGILLQLSLIQSKPVFQSI